MVKPAPGSINPPSFRTYDNEQELLDDLCSRHDRHKLKRSDLTEYLQSPDGFIIGTPTHFATAKLRSAEYRGTKQIFRDQKTVNIPTTLDKSHDGLEELIGPYTGQVTLHADRIQAYFNRSRAQVVVPEGKRYVSHRWHSSVDLHDSELELRFDSPRMIMPDNVADTLHRANYHVNDFRLVELAGHAVALGGGILGAAGMLSSFAFGTPDNWAIGAGVASTSYFAGRLIINKARQGVHNAEIHDALGDELAHEKFSTPLLLAQTPAALAQQIRESYHNQDAA